MTDECVFQPTEGVNFIVCLRTVQGSAATAALHCISHQGEEEVPEVSNYNPHASVQTKLNMTESTKRHCQADIVDPPCSRSVRSV